LKIQKLWLPERNKLLKLLVLKMFAFQPDNPDWFKRQQFPAFCENCQGDFDLPLLLRDISGAFDTLIALFRRRINKK